MLLVAAAMFLVLIDVFFVHVCMCLNDTRYLIPQQRKSDFQHFQFVERREELQPAALLLYNNLRHFYAMLMF